MAHNEEKEIITFSDGEHTSTVDVTRNEGMSVGAKIALGLAIFAGVGGTVLLYEGGKAIARKIPAVNNLMTNREIKRLEKNGHFVLTAEQMAQFTKLCEMAKALEEEETEIEEEEE